jgi:hypothetical protein
MKKKSKTKYSWQTSLPAYLENAEGKDMQEKLVLYVMRRLRGKTTLKEIQDHMRIKLGIRLPQSTISGRMNDLKDKDKVGFFGETRIYKDRIRKVFEVITTRNKRKKRVGKKIIYEKVYPLNLKKDKQGKYFILKLSDGSIWRTKSGEEWGRSNKPKQKFREALTILRKQPPNKRR